MQAFALFCAVMVKTESTCDQPIDLNQATLSELDSLPYITPATGQLIMDIRPICSPLELTYSPKKIIGITEDRLNNKWNWFLNKNCSETCCKAQAFCDETFVPSTPEIYSWQTAVWSECTAECGNGKQYRDVTCVDPNNAIVDNIYCLTIPYKPINKQICNTKPCPKYKWMPSKWQRCMVDPNGNCVQKRELFCYDTVNDIREAATKCDAYCNDKPDIMRICDSCAPGLIESISIRSERPGSKRSLLDWDSTMIGDVQVAFDLTSSGNTCQTDMYRNVDDKTLIIRRGCYAYILIYVMGLPNNPTVDLSWFYLDATLQADTPQIDDDIWYNNYLSWIPYTDEQYPTAGWLAVNIPSDGYIGEFTSNLYYQENGNSANRQLITDFTVYVLYNPYNINDEVYMSSAVDIEEYVENEFGLIWVGSSNANSAMQWHYDQFHFPNLKIAMDTLHRLDLDYRNNLVLISRQISYAVGRDICYGRWSGSYTRGTPSGGYACTPFAQENTCKEPWAWTGTTQLFDLYRDIVNYQRVQYCQCFVYAGVSTTVGRALGIPTRPTTNFQSAHDYDYNRAIEKYWILSSDGRYLTPASGEDVEDIEIHDSVWNFHVWNEMYFQRSDFTDSAYNNRGWQIIDATPQELSCGGNPKISCAYQLGPASLTLIKDNRNPNECIATSLPPNNERFGCFDTEFVISETNANFNFWLKDEDAPSGTKFELQYILVTDPFDEEHGTIGALTNTKKPGAVDDDCLNEAIGDCDDEYLDLTLVYKWEEPSDPGTPTDNTNTHSIGDLSDRRRRTMRRRRRLWSLHEYTLDDLDSEGIEYSVETIPYEYYVTPMIIADDTSDIIDLYGDDYTFGMISIIMDSYHDNPLNVYCGFTLTAHNYNGEKIYLNNDNTTNGIVKSEKDNFILEAGESGACQFKVNYNEYSEWISVNTTPRRKRQRNFDGSDTPFAFKFTVSVSLFNDIDTKPYQIIIEERDILVCTPKLKLKDRIMCHHKMKWFEPSKLEYECNGLTIDNAIGDGFCDEENNFDGCYDGGDCCKSTCIPSENYKCPPIFNCINDEIKYQKHNKNYKKCPKISSFIDYIDKVDEVRESPVCSDAINNFVCSKDYDSQCMNSILSKKDIRLFGKIENCFDEMFDSLDTQMKQIVQKIIECAIENGQLKEKRAKKREEKNKKESSAFSVVFGNEFNNDKESNKDWYEFYRLVVGDNVVVLAFIIFALMMSIIICILYACKCNKKYEGMAKISYDTEEMQSDIEQHPMNH